METRYVTLNARHRTVPRAGEQASGGGVLCEDRVEYRAGLHTVPAGGGKVLDLAEYRRRLGEAAAEKADFRPEEDPSPTRPGPAWRERLTLALDGLATAALVAAAGGLLLAAWSWM